LSTGIIRLITNLKICRYQRSITSKAIEEGAIPVMGDSRSKLTNHRFLGDTMFKFDNVSSGSCSVKLLDRSERGRCTQNMTSKKSDGGEGCGEEAHRIVKTGKVHFRKCGVS